MIVAAHRQDRPWTGETHGEAEPAAPAHDPDCYLCPENVRSSGERNPRYASTFVFDNDPPPVGPEAPPRPPPPGEPYRVRPATGIARVVCFSPRHDLTLAEMPSEEARDVGDVAERVSRSEREAGNRSRADVRERGESGRGLEPASPRANRESAGQISAGALSAAAFAVPIPAFLGTISLLNVARAVGLVDTGMLDFSGFLAATYWKPSRREARVTLATRPPPRAHSYVSEF